jgi:hypothetical protein
MSKMYRLLGKDNLNVDERWLNVLWPRGSPRDTPDFVDIFLQFWNLPTFVPTSAARCPCAQGPSKSKLAGWYRVGRLTDV